MAVSPDAQFNKSVKYLKQNDTGLILKLLPYIRRYPRLLLLSLSLLLPLSVAGAIQPLIIGQAVSLLRQENTWPFLEKLSLDQGLQFLIILLLITIIIRLFCTSSQGFIVQKLGQNITAAIRQDLFTHVTSLGTSFFNRTPVGRLITRLTSDVEALGDVFASGAIGVISDAIYILFIIITMFTVQSQLALMLLLMMLPIAILIMYFQGQYRKANYKSREKLSELNSMLQENLAGINVVQLFRREQFNSELFRVINHEYRQAADKTIFYDSAVSATLEWISLVAIAAVLWLGGTYIINDTITFGTLSAFILYAQRFFNPLRQFADKFTMFQAGFTAIERITELMREPIEIKESDKNIQFLESRQYQDKVGEICFEHVWFGYKPDEFVLKDLNFTISPGEKVALVGPTGAGKSSIIRLLSRLHEPTKGRILIDGVDIRDISKKELRQYIGMILQESFLFAGDVKRNITLGENYSLEEVENAAKLTNVHDLIAQLPQGYHTQLRERGTNLSGGQKQLLAFARVAIRNPHIVVLDEATASLDVQTEALIQEALEKLLIKRTAVIIAHRLSTIRDVDTIFVLKEGRIVESGTHQQLLNQTGLYHSLYQLQLMGYDESTSF